MVTTDAESDFALVYDDRFLWYLASGTKIREIGAHGRTFIADSRTPGRVWHGAHLTHISAIEMPVEVSRGK